MLLTYLLIAMLCQTKLRFILIVIYLSLREVKLVGIIGKIKSPLDTINRRKKRPAGLFVKNRSWIADKAVGAKWVV